MNVIGTADYEVVFNRDVTACSYQGTMSFNHGEIVVERGSTNPNSAVAETYSSAGVLETKRFAIAVFC